MSTNLDTLAPIPRRIVADALRIAHVPWESGWTHGSIGDSAGRDEPRFRELLPRGAKWDLARPFAVKRDGTKFATVGVSTCGLIAVGILCRAGVPLSWMSDQYWRWQDPQLPDRGAYRGLDVVSCLSLLGARLGARRAAGVYPEPGDIVCIGNGLATHVLTVVSGDGHYVWSVDGGQVDQANGYLQCVKLLRRDWRGLRVQWALDSSELARRLAQE